MNRCFGFCHAHRPLVTVSALFQRTHLCVEVNLWKQPEAPGGRRMREERLIQRRTLAKPAQAKVETLLVQAMKTMVVWIWKHFRAMQHSCFSNVLQVYDVERELTTWR